MGGAAAARRVRGRGGAAPTTKSNIHAAIFSTRSYGNLPEEGYLATMRGGTCSMSGPLRSRQRLTERGRPLARGAASPSGTASHGLAIWSRPVVSAVVAPMALRDARPPPPRRVWPSVRASRSLSIRSELEVASFPRRLGERSEVRRPPPVAPSGGRPRQRRGPGAQARVRRPPSGRQSRVVKKGKTNRVCVGACLPGRAPSPVPVGRGRCRWLPG